MFVKVNNKFFNVPFTTMRAMVGLRSSYLFELNEFIEGISNLGERLIASGSEMTYDSFMDGAKEEAENHGLFTILVFGFSELLKTIGSGIHEEYGFDPEGRDLSELQHDPRKDLIFALDLDNECLVNCSVCKGRYTGKTYKQITEIHRENSLKEIEEQMKADPSVSDEEADALMNILRNGETLG